MTRHLLTALALVALAGCGGTWSNKDLEFVSALPRPEDLRAKIPLTASSTSPLEGVSTRRDGLNVGDPSNAYANAKKASGEFNTILDTLLSIIDRVRQVPPTTRTKDTRVWGPWPDSNNPGFEFQVVIKQVDDVNFAWGIQSRPKNGAFFDVVQGAFKASASARRGQGLMKVLVKDFRDVLKVDDNFKQLDEIDVGYITDMFPRRVEMLFTFRAGSTSGLSALGYTYREQEDTSAAMRFQLRTTSPDATVLEMNAAWLANGSGRGLGRVLEGTYAGATISECWDTAFKVTYYEETWPGGQKVGDPASCVAIPGLTP